MTTNIKQKHAKRCKNCDCGIPDERLGGLFELKIKKRGESYMLSENKISYSAIVLTDESRNKLLSKLADRIPEGWDVVAHHVTIKMGELPPELKPSIGLPVTLKASGFYVNDKVAAIEAIVPPEIRPFVKNKHPHITVAVNRAAGGKPVVSNDLIAKSLQTDEESGTVGRYTTPIDLMGQIQEIPQQ
jgi:hypothetical protein